ncbi:MAG TPA: hypothetical protein VF119_08080 [Candidatus Limnocylindrales bacterium]
MTDDATTATDTILVKAPPRRSRRVLAGIVAILACLSILITSVAIWTHQVAFKTDRFTALVSTVIAEPAVIDPLADRISVQVVDALDVQTRIANRLPDVAKSLAPMLTIQIQEAIDRRLQTALTNPKVQTGLTNTIAFAHERIMRLLRGESDAVTVVDGYVTIEVWPVVGAALEELQSSGLIPPEVTLPDLSTAEPPGILSGRLATALGVTLPPDFGTIRLMPADRLVAAQTYVRIFDAIVVILVVLSLVLVALALWLSTNRRRMLVYLAIGTIIAFLLARLATGGIENIPIGGIADQDLAGAVKTVVDAAIADLRSLTAIILVATIIVAVAAYLWGRPKWVTQVASSAGSAAGRAGSAAGAAAGSAAGAVTTAAPSRDTVAEVVTTNRASVEKAGIVVIVFIILWIAIGLDIALLAAALFIGFELVMRALSSRSDDGDGGPETPQDS